MKYFLIALSSLFFIACSESNSKEETTTPVENYQIVETEIGSKITDLYLPDSLFFAGEKVPLDEPYVREAIQKELMVNAFRHSKALHLIKVQPRWKPMIDSVLIANNIPKDFFYLAVTESYLDNTAKSPAKAQGMWQFIPSTGKEYGLKIAKDYDMRRDPWLATIAACKYFNKAHSKFDNWTLSAASYNRGMRGVSKSLENQKVKSFYDLYLNSETTRYIYRIISFKLILENPEKYGFYINEKEKYKPYQYSKQEITKSINSLVDYAQENHTTYKKLRLYNPWLNNASTFSLKIKKGDTLTVRVPLNN